MSQPRRTPGFRPILSLITLAASPCVWGCEKAKGVNIFEVEDPTAVGIEADPTPIDEVQGRLFTLFAKVRMSDGTLGDPSDLTITLPPGVTLIFSEVLSGTRTKRYSLVGLDEISDRLYLEHPDFPNSQAVPVTIRAADIRIQADRELTVDGDMYGVVLLQGDLVKIDASLTENGCAIENGGALFNATVSGDLDKITHTPFSIADLNDPGCQEAPEAGSSAVFAWEDAPGKISVNYDVRGKGKEVHIGAFYRRFAPEMVGGGLGMNGTATTTNNGSCGPLDPGEFPYTGTVLNDETDGLRMVTPDGGVYHIVQDENGDLTFTSDPTTVATGVQAIEVMGPAPAPVGRDLDGNFTMPLETTSRIFYYAAGQYLCYDEAYFSGEIKYGSPARFLY